MPMYKRSIAILLVLVCAGIVGTLYGYYSNDDAISLEVKTSKDIKAGSGKAAGKIAVYVSGAVNRPGIVTLDDGSRVADAINACGGILPTADSNSINMAQVLKDGQQIKVNERTGSSSSNNGANGNNAYGNGNSNNNSSGGKGNTANSGTKVNINQADAKALEALKGIGPAMAQRIVEYRSANGSFQSPEDLQKVKGIGKAKFEKLKDQIEL